MLVGPAVVAVGLLLRPQKSLIEATGAEEFFQYDIAARQGVITNRRGGDRLVQYDDLGTAPLSKPI
jgi:hypothetical protein